MRPFAFERAENCAAAVRAARTPGSVLLAGGTDLVRLMKRGLVRPERVVDVARIEDLRHVRRLARGALEIGAAVRLAELERLAAPAEGHRALFEAVCGIATAQIRNVATVAGSLLQRPSCWYFRGGFDCLLAGGTGCPATSGDNRHGGIFAASPCRAGHPSDLAAALLALGASVELRRASRTRIVPITALWRLPSTEAPSERALAPGEVVTRILVPAPERGQRSVFLRARDRAAWAFPLVAVAARAKVARGKLAGVRIAAAGVAPIPWTIADPSRPASGAAAHPTAAYKVAILEALVARALARLAEA